MNNTTVEDTTTSSISNRSSISNHRNFSFISVDASSRGSVIHFTHTDGIMNEKEKDTVISSTSHIQPILSDSATISQQQDIPITPSDKEETFEVTRKNEDGSTIPLRLTLTQ